jgi:hypothetical protein
MFYNEEKELTELSERINSKPAPDCIDEYIKSGIKLGQIKKKKNKVKILTNVAALITFVILLTSIRISPVFASYVSKIPGLQYIVNLVNFDKGVSDAVNNNFIQPINISQEHEGLVFTLKDVIIDNSKAILFYSIQNKTNHKFVNIAEINLKDAKGKQVISCSTMGLFMEDISKQKELVGKVEFNFSARETIIPDVLYIDVKLQDEDTNDTPSHDKRKVLASTWKFNIPIHKEKFESMKKVYTLNQNIEIEGQKILFKTVTITPTQISAEIDYDKSNSKKILGYDDISIINEKGEKWATIMNGVSGSRKDDDHQTLFFQSNYFTNPKELYIKGSSIKALDKDKLKVIVDVDKKVLIKAPDDKLTLKSVTAIKGKPSLEFELLKDKILDKDKGYFVFQYDFEDSDGNLINQKASGGTHLNGTDRQYIDYTITTDSKFKNPIFLTIWDYPTRIKGDFKVKIK